MNLKPLLTVVAVLAMTWACHAADQKSVLTPEVVKKIQEAAPAKAAVQPARPRKLLVMTLTKGFYHDVIPIGAKAMEIIGAKTGAWETVITEDPMMFVPEKLAQFDAVMMMNTTGELFDVPDKAMRDVLKKSLVDFVKGGKGLAGSHAATDTFYQFPEYGQMIGGYFNGHPFYEIAVKNEDPDHPINAAFKGKGFEIRDEMYTFRAPYSRENLRILLSIDLANSRKIENDPARPGFKKGENRDDHDYAISWIREYGQGRVFYCSFGHFHDVFWNPAILKHYLDGIQYAIGDLKADATPSARRGGSPAGADSAPLFNGRDLAGWEAKPDGWKVENGELVWQKGCGSIWSKQQYGDFVLDLEFKVAPKTNSGVFIRTGNPKDPVQTGIEIQVLDSYGKARPGKNDCASVYDCLAPSENAEKKPGEWNRMVITAKANRIQVVLNDKQVIDMDLDQWTEPGKNPNGTPNKYKKAFKDFPRSGHIGLQDHGGAVWYRNIRISRL